MTGGGGRLAGIAKGCFPGPGLGGKADTGESRVGLWHRLTLL